MLSTSFSLLRPEEVTSNTYQITADLVYLIKNIRLFKTNRSFNPVVINPVICYESTNTSQNYHSNSKKFFQLKNCYAREFDRPIEIFSNNIDSHSGNPSPNPNINTKISINRQTNINNEALLINIDKEIINNITNSWKIVSNKDQSKGSDQEGLSAISDDERKKIAIYILIAKSFDGMSSLKKREQVKAFIEYLNINKITTDLELSCDEAFKFSYQFQQHSKGSGFMTGRENPGNYVGMRLKRIPEVIISKFLVNKFTEKVIDDYSKLRESFYHRLYNFQPNILVR